MHIHLDQNPGRPIHCEATHMEILISIETIADFSGMDPHMAQTWLTERRKAIHDCHGLRYVHAHMILKFLTEENADFNLPPPTAINMLAHKLTKYLAPHAHGHDRLQVLGSTRNSLSLDTALNQQFRTPLPVPMLDFSSINQPSRRDHD